AVAEDVVEFSEGLIEIENADGAQVEIAEAEVVRLRAAGLDLAGGEIDPGEAARGQLERHRDEVPAVRAAELQDAAALGRRRVESAKDRARRELVGMGLVVRGAGVGDALV